MELVLTTLLSATTLLPLLYVWKSPEATPVPLETSWRDMAQISNDDVLVLPFLRSDAVIHDKAA